MKQPPSPFAHSRALPIEIKDFEKKDIENVKELNQWDSCCCGDTDSRLLKFIAQYFLIWAFFTFCVFMLYKAETCEDSQLYSSLLLLVVGVIIPNPR